MEQNTDQTQLLQALYSKYLSRNIQLEEQLTQAELKIAQLEKAIEESPSRENPGSAGFVEASQEGGEAEGDSEANS